MAATIKIKNSSTAGAAPTSSDLVQGELAVNVTDKRLYTENASGTIVELGTNPSVPVTFPDGSASAPSLTNDGDTNTGLFFPAADTVGIATGGTERARVDSSGNLGLGVTPSAWSLKALQVNGASIFGYTSLNANIGANFYYDGSANKYIANGAAELLQLDAGAFKFFNATSGTAGNAITFTQAMTLDASGNLFVGATSAGFAEKFRVYGNYSVFDNGTFTGFIGSGSSLGTGTGSDFAIRSSNAIAFLSGGATERARIDSSGNLLVGATAGTGGNERLFVSASGNFNAVRVYNYSGTSPQGIYMYYPNVAPNGTGSSFFTGGDVSATRVDLRSNGGIANYSANNVNLSDRREKTNFAPAGDYLAKICAIPVQTFNYIDQNMEEDGGLTLGVVAQDVQAVAPELVMESNWAGKDEEPKMRLSIYQTDLQYALMKCIQEQQAIITKLQADVAALKG